MVLVGGLVYGNSFGTGLQYHEWTSFISDTEFCFRACVGSMATSYCQHIYDIMGCYWNMPANYDAGVFENCDAANEYVSFLVNLNSADLRAF